MKQKLSSLINEAIKEKIFSAIAIEVSHNNKPIISEYIGRTNFEEDKERTEDITPDHLFDLASLTKPLCTSMLSKILMDQNQLTLNTNVAEIFDQYALSFNKALEPVTIEDLLNHSSGLEAWAPIYKMVKSRSDAYMFVRSRSLDYRTGSKHVYSDLGYIMLGEIIEILMGKRLDHLFEGYVSELLELHNIRFIPSNIDHDGDKFVCSGHSNIRDKALYGEVNDENCFAFGGVAGHAGLFGTAKDVCLLAENIKGTLTKITGHEWNNGWHYPTKDKSSAGKFISENSLGMTGFTGTSVWMDFDKDMVITILANRTVSPHSAKFGGESDKFTELRPKLHDIILGEFH